MLKMFRYLRNRDWLYALVSLVFIIIQVFLDLKMPDYMSEITTLVQTGDSQMSDILTVGSYMLLCALGSLVAAFIVGYFVAKIAAGLAMTLRENVHGKTMSFSMEELGKFSIPSLITRSTNDITQVQMFVAMGLQFMIKAPIQASWAIVKISGKSWQWTLTTSIAVAILLLMLSIIIALTTPKFKKIQKFTDRINGLARENLTGIRVIRAYNAESYQETKFEDANNELTKTNVFAHGVMAIQQPGMGLIQYGLTLAIFWVGAYLIDAATMADKPALLSDMVAFSTYVLQVFMAIMMLTMTFIAMPRASVSAKRINEVLETEETILDGTMETFDPAYAGEVEFRSVSFRYPNTEQPVLHDISFAVKKGETVAFIGSTGSGKSTLVNLVPRFYDATEGEVLVNGVNVKDFRQEALRDRLAYVPQKSVLFSGTVASNVAFGIEDGMRPSENDIVDAVHVAQASDFVEQMPGNYQARIAQGGTNVSGGQKQRLSIARAVYRRPDIFIFDDSFSALDYKTDREIRSALRKQTKGATSLIVAQRIGTIMDADKIIVLDEGKIVSSGTHQELLKSCEVYREIAESQLSKEEIEDAS